MRKIVKALVVGGYAVSLSFTIILCFTVPTFSNEKQQVTEAEVLLMEKLPPLLKKGLIVPANISKEDEEGVFFVEPLFWKKLTYVEKYDLLLCVQAFYNYHNKKKGGKIVADSVNDMMKKRTILGLINLKTGKIYIEK